MFKLVVDVHDGFVVVVVVVVTSVAVFPIIIPHQILLMLILMLTDSLKRVAFDVAFFSCLPKLCCMPWKSVRLFMWTLGYFAEKVLKYTLCIKSINKEKINIT